MTPAGLVIRGVAAWTPAGDLDATIAAIDAGTTVAPCPPAVAGASRTARLLGPLPATAVEVARTAARELPAGERTGVFLAHGGLRAHWDDLAPAMAEQVEDATASWARGLKRLHPLWMLRYLTNGAQAAIAHELGLVGDGATYAGPTAAASAIASATEAIAAGAIDHAVIVAIDDLTAIEVAVELAAREPGITPSLAVAAIAVSRRNLTELTASGGKGAESLCPDPGQLTKVTASGFGAAGPLLGAAIAIRREQGHG